MTDKKISELTELTTPTTNDLLAIVNSGETKKIQHGNLAFFPLAGIFGGIHVHDNAVAQSIPAGATYTKSTVFADNSDGFSDVTPDAANDKITLNTAGYYLVNCSLNFYDGTNNVVWWASVFVGGVEYDQIHIHRKISTANDVGSASMSGILKAATVPVDLDIRVRHDNVGAINLTITYANFSVAYLGSL